MTDQFDWLAIRSGALTCLLFGVSFSLLGRWAADDDNSGLATLLILLALAGFVVGSGVAAWTQRTGLPLVHGLITASGTYLVTQTVLITFRLLTGRDVRWYAALFNITPVLFAGLLGGLLGMVLQRRGITPGQRGTGITKRSDS